VDTTAKVVTTRLWLPGSIDKLSTSLRCVTFASSLVQEEGVKLALDESAKAIAELERLRENHSALLSKSIRSDFDLEHTKWEKMILGEKVADLEHNKWEKKILGEKVADLEHNKWEKKILGEKVADLEKVVNDIREEVSRGGHGWHVLAISAGCSWCECTLGQGVGEGQW
jgi:hypothetical protein